MQRLIVTLAFLLSACVLDEATEEDIAEVESESATSGPTVVALTDGQFVTVSGAANSVKYFKLEVPAGFDHVTLVRSGYVSGSGRFYMRRNQLPSPSLYDCTSSIYQSCNVSMPVAGTYYIAIYAGQTSGYTNLTFAADHRNTYTPISNGYSESFYNQYGVDRQYKLSVPDNVSSVSFTYTLDPNDDGRLDMVVKRNGFATDMNYDCFKYVDFYYTVTTAMCTFTNPTPGTYYVALLGYNTKVVGTFSARYKLAFMNAPVSTSTSSTD